MKKIVLIAAIALASFNAAFAQNTTLANSKLTDNWYFGINGGGITPMSGSFFPNMRANAGLEIGHYMTPIFGMGLEARAAFNTTPSKTVVDQTNVRLLGKFNLMNLFGGYKGTPRTFEIVAIAGPGYGHDFGSKFKDNFITANAGAELNFNLADAWQFNLRPVAVWGLKNKLTTTNMLKKRAGAVELSAGFTYKFACSNGTHNFALAKTYDQGEVNSLNNTINALRNDIAAKDAKAKEYETTIANLQNSLNECMNKAPQVVEKHSTTEKMTLESVVTFAQGKTVIAPSQLPNVERIATYLKNHKDAKVIIKGFASPEGSIEVNNRIALARATSVKNMLMSKYKIAEGRISAEGQGIGNMFSEPDWNRVSICTIDESNEK